MGHLKEKAIHAADNWAREVMRSDKLLSTSEIELLEAIIALKNADKIPLPANSRLPPPPKIPTLDDIPTSITPPRIQQQLIEKSRRRD